MSFLRNLVPPPAPVRVPESKYEGAYHDNLTFSGCDIIPVVYAHDPHGNPHLFVIGDIATLTYSIHQDKGAVRTLGRTAPKSFVRGNETIAGTLIFNIFNRQALHELSHYNRDSRTRKTTHAHRLPSFDILLYFHNEHGSEGILGVFGIQIVDEGQSHSVEDTYVENTMQYLAHYVEPLEMRRPGAVPGFASFIAGKGPAASRKVAQRGLGPASLPFDYRYLTPD